MIKAKTAVMEYLLDKLRRLINRGTRNVKSFSGKTLEKGNATLD